MHTLLPASVREALAAAAAIGNDRERAIAIEEATRRARLQHPHLFQPEPEEPCESQ